MIRSLFWNPEQRRLRALWRLLLFLLIVALFANLFAYALDATVPPPLEGLLLNPLVALAFFIGLWLSARYLDRRPLRDFGLGHTAAWWQEFAAGVAIGGGMVSAAFLAAWLTGGVALRAVGFSAMGGVPFAVALLGQVVRYAAGSFFEEVMSRSYLLRVLAEGLAGSPLSRRRALLASWAATSLLFGALHLANPHATPLSMLNLTLLGALFGMGMVYTGRLALPIGLHMAWNVFQNNIFGLPNSGKPTTAALLVTEMEGAAWWTGGAFGLEGGVLSLAALLLGGLLVWGWLRRRYGQPTLQLALADPPAAPRPRGTGEAAAP